MHNSWDTLNKSLPYCFLEVHAKLSMKQSRTRGLSAQLFFVNDLVFFLFIAKTERNKRKTEKPVVQRSDLLGILVKGEGMRKKREI